MDRQKKAYTFALLAMLCWSTVATAFKISLRYMDYLNLLLYSSLISALVLLIIISIQGKFKEIFSIPKKELTFLALLGALNPFLYYLVLFKAYSLLKAQEALTLNYTWAIMVVVLSFFILKQKIKFVNIFGIFLGFCGVFIIASKGHLYDMQFSNTFGVALALGSSIIWAFFWILNIKIKRDELIKLFINFGSGFIFTLISCIILGDIKILPAEGMFGAVYVGLFEMGITFIFWLMALKYSKTTAQVSSIIYLSPFLSLIFINLILGEKILYATFIGLCLIIIGIVIQSINQVDKPLSEKLK